MSARTAHAERGVRIAHGLTVAAAASYLGSCALGGLATMRRGSTRRVRWLHHALYISTFALTGAATAASLAARERAGAPLLGALVALARIPSVSGRSRAHPVIAASMAPCYAAALALAHESPNTRRR